MSSVNYLLKRIAYLEDQLSEETDEDRKISLYEDLELAKDDLRFEYAEQEAEEDYQRLKSEGWA
jgi:hypothetical protein